METVSDHLASHEAIGLIVSMIPPGCVASYGQVAKLAGLPGRARMVAKWMSMASGDEALPWHRVINSQGRISIPQDSPFYAIQWELLVADGVLVNEGRVSMARYRWQPDEIDIMFALQTLGQI